METQQSMGDQFLALVKQIIEDNIGDENFTVSILAKEVGLSRSMLHRKLIRLTGKSATTIITEIRLERAWELLEKDAATVSEIAYKVGFTSPSYFNKVFKKTYEIRPGEVRKKGLGKRLSILNSARKKRMTWRIASIFSFIMIAVLIALLILLNTNKIKGSDIREKSIAVLPFDNLSEESGNKYFVDGLVEDLLNRISIIEELKVISHTTSEMYREKGNKSVPQIAEELNVAYILEGSVQRYGQNVRVSVQLIDAKNDDYIWADLYDRNIDDIFTTQSEIALKIASELDAILSSEQKALIQQDKTRNVRAFELYQMGRFFWNKRTEEGYLKSIKYFEQSVETDPGYGLAYAGMADTYQLMALQGYMDKMEGRDKAEDLALHAMELDGQLAEAYTVLGSLYCYVDWEWEKAEDALLRALSLNPNYSTAHQYYAELLSIVGRHEEARVHIDKAIELDPLSFVIRFQNVEIYYFQGYFDEALRELDICEEIEGSHRWIDYRRFYCYFHLGQEDKAFEELKKSMLRNPVYDSHRAEQIYQESGVKAVLEWKTEIDSAEGNSMYGIASDLALLGKDEEALDWLEKAVRVHEWIAIKWDIHFRSLHDNPRYQSILEEMRLGE